MGLQPSGYNGTREISMVKTNMKDIELIFLKTEYFDVTIKGKLVHPDSEKLYRNNTLSHRTTALLQVDCPRGHIEEFYHFRDRKSTRLNSSHVRISYAVFCLKKKNIIHRE